MPNGGVADQMMKKRSYRRGSLRMLGNLRWISATKTVFCGLGLQVLSVRVHKMSCRELVA